MPAFLLPLIMAGAQIATNLYGAKKASDAAKKASEQQAQSGREALALQQQLYQQSRADLAPYREGGNQALTEWLALMGLPPSAAAGAGPMAPPLTDTRGARVPGPGAEYTGHYAVPRGPGGLPGTAPGGSMYGPPASPAGIPSGPMVQLRAPTGQTKLVPASQVDYYLARGATRG